MKIKAVDLKTANSFINEHHRHHKKVQGHKFSIGAFDVSEILIGVCIVGRPVARMTDHTKIVEVTRLCTIGAMNACSKLYGAAARAAKELGYESIQTFILDSEFGKSLKAAGWKKVSETQGGSWSRPSRERVDKAPIVKKQKYVKELITKESAK